MSVPGFTADVSLYGGGKESYGVSALARGVSQGTSIIPARTCTYVTWYLTYDGCRGAGLDGQKLGQWPYFECTPGYVRWFLYACDSP